MSAPTNTGRALAWAVPVLAEAAALGRSVAFAWWIGPDELGRAMMLALTVRLVEMASDVGADRLILQAPDGNSARLLADLHGAMLIRGIAGAAILVCLAPILAGLFADGPAWTSYALLAAVPLLRGAANLDFRRSERRFRYAPMALVEGGATLAMVVSILPASAMLGDHRAMLAALIAHAVACLGLSRLVATRAYRLRFSRASLRRIWRFGAPLAMNAVLLFLTFYADRLIVARAYDWATLALYGIALQLALLPAQIVGRAAASLVLPQLREVIRSGTLAEVWPRIVASHAALGLGLAAGFALIAPAAIALVYGDALRPDPALALVIGIAAGFRVLRTPFSQLAIASGRTGDPARANLLRSLALLPAAGFAAAGFPLVAIAAAAAAGEAGATLRAWLLARASLIRPTSQEAFA
ncbi:oligosaccharide flippase family protein [Aestuariicoccus sp. MJ-SS9]|uniref:oligosaccharide flippase family protein n=1 Tax=Aestuariicoccus sp. MJ-SS9 TaxID=3079855 RepID=UPI002915AB9C|nr:oligosaccharide flippase family protein [Aestuariicoccus sp. MJ-SS9]MDU8913702.1 oligosaccharide flippase family protein [Aestuariicoccus sp. MJ-SS9]